MNRRVSLALLAGLFAWGAAPADEAYTIKRKEPGAGDSVQVERTDTLKATTLLVAKNAKATDKAETKFIEKSDTTVETSAYKETVLERDGAKAPTKLERAYTKAQVTAGGPATDLPYHDKTVVIEKKGERYTFSYKGGKELPPEDSPLLDLEFNRTPADRGALDRPPPPPGAVKVDEGWKLDLAALLKPLEKGGDLGFDVAKATGTGKLLKVYKKDDKTFGELRYTVKVPLTSFGQGKQKLSVKEGSSATFEVTQDVCIDGTSDAGVLRSKAELTAKGTLPTPQGDGDLTLTVVREVQETRKELKK
jgi:hypothetical protein